MNAQKKSATENKSSSSKADSELTLFLGHIVSPVDARKYSDIKDGAMVVDGDGTIVFVGGSKDCSKRFPTVSQTYDFQNKLIVPGFVDMHLHLPQVTETGKSGEHLMGWLEKYIFPSEARFADTEYAARIARWFFDELARNGTTTAVVMCTIHKDATDVAFEAAARQGIRVVMGKVMMNVNATPALTENLIDSLAGSEELCRKWHGHDSGRLMYAFTPRFAVTSTREALMETGKLWAANKGSYMHTHLAESIGEIELVKELFPEFRTYTDVYDAHGLTGERTIFAHSIHLDDDDMNLLKNKECSLAHCPSSNFFLKSGIFKYSAVERLGIRFGIGSDVAAGPQMSLLGVMKDANYSQSDRWLTPSELFYRATLAGARALFLDDKIGSLEPGKEADFVVLDPTRRTGIPHDILLHPTDDILSSLVFLGDDRVITETYVRGKCIFSAPGNDCS